jgi:hypothetical protein
MKGHPHPLLILELERADHETLAGRVFAAYGTAVEFARWLGLAGAIEAAVRVAQAEDDRARTTEGHSDD